MESSIRCVSFEEDREDREVNQNEAEGSAAVAHMAAVAGKVAVFYFYIETIQYFSWVYWGEKNPETTLRIADVLLRFELFKL